MPPRSRKLSVVQDHLLLPSVRCTLTHIEKDRPDDLAIDEGLRKLAEVYATAIDEAQSIALDAKKLIAEAQKDDGLEIAKRMLNALVKYSDATGVLEQLGPKLQAALEALGASPKARATMTGKGGKGDGPAKPSSLAQRRAAAAARESGSRSHGSSPVDSASS